MNDLIKIRLHEALYKLNKNIEQHNQFKNTYSMGFKWWRRWKDLAERKYKLIFEPDPESKLVNVYKPDYESSYLILTYNTKTGEVNTNLSLDELSGYKTKAPAEEPVDEVKLYHGGPHEFEKFSTQYMGSGEGFQTYGWGVYLTNNDQIALVYARDIVQPVLDKIGIQYDSLSPELQKIIKSYMPFVVKPEWLTQEIQKGTYAHLPAEDLKILTAFAAFKTKNPEAFKANIYTVNIDKKLNLIKWLEPIPSSQLKSIAAANKNIGQIIMWIIEYNKWNQNAYKKPSEASVKEFFENNREDDLNPNNINTLLNALNSQNEMHGNVLNGENIYKLLANILGSEKNASLFLTQHANIDGIKYPCNNNNPATCALNGFNYVIFDPNIINIAKRKQI